MSKLFQFQDTPFSLIVKMKDSIINTDDKDNLSLQKK